MAPAPPTLLLAAAAAVACGLSAASEHPVDVKGNISCGVTVSGDLAGDDHHAWRFEVARDNTVITFNGCNASFFGDIKIYYGHDDNFADPTFRNHYDYGGDNYDRWCAPGGTLPTITLMARRSTPQF